MDCDCQHGRETHLGPRAATDGAGRRFWPRALWHLHSARNRRVYLDLLKFADCLPSPHYTLTMTNSAQCWPTLLFVWKVRTTELCCKSKAGLLLHGLGEDANGIVAGSDAFQTRLNPREAWCTILSSSVGRAAGGEGDESPHEMTQGHNSAHRRCQDCWAFHRTALSQAANIWHLLGCIVASNSHVPPPPTSPCHKGGISASCWCQRGESIMVSQGPEDVPSRVTEETSSRVAVLRAEQGFRRWC